MKTINRFKRSAIRGTVLAGLFAGVVGASDAQIVLGHHYRPHYWDLPTKFDQPFNFPGQTLLFNSTSKRYDDNGKRVDTGVDTDTLFGFTILPHFFKFDPASDWAFAFSLNSRQLWKQHDLGRIERPREPDRKRKGRRDQQRADEDDKQAETKIHARASSSQRPASSIARTRFVAKWLAAGRWSLI